MMNRVPILTVCLLVAAATGFLVLPSCTSEPVARHLAADQDSLTEAGRALEVSEMTLRLHGQFQGTNPDRWRELSNRAGQLGQGAGRLIMRRATAVSGSRSEAEQFYSGLGADTAALKAEREKLTADVLAAIKP